MSGSGNGSSFAMRWPHKATVWTWIAAIALVFFTLKVVYIYPSPLWGIVPASQDVKAAFNAFAIVGVFVYVTPLTFCACVVLSIIRRAATRTRTRAFASSALVLAALLLLCGLSWDPGYMPGVQGFLAPLLSPAAAFLGLPLVAASVYTVKAQDFSLPRMLGIAALALAVLVFLFSVGHVLVAGENG